MRAVLLLVSIFFALFGSAGYAAIPERAPVAHGTWVIARSGDLLSFEADAAPIEDVLAGLQEIIPVEVRMKPTESRTVSAKYPSITIEDLLFRLGLTYVLVYEQTEAGGDATLSSGWVSLLKPEHSAVESPFGPLQHDGSSRKASGVLPDKVREILRGAVSSPGFGSSSYRAPMPLKAKVDGSTRDWPEGVAWQAVTPSRVYTAGDTTNAMDPDLSFTLAAMADEAYLYFAVDVIDDGRAAKSDRLGAREDDSVQLRLLPIGSTNVPMTATINRHHVLTDATASGTVPVQYVSFHNGTRAAIRDGADGWTIEVAIPRSDDESDTPAFGFDMAVTDYDANDTNGVTTLSWQNGYTIGPASSGQGTGMLELIPINP